MCNLELDAPNLTPSDHERDDESNSDDDDDDDDGGDDGDDDNNGGDVIISKPQTHWLSGMKSLYVMKTILVSII